MSLVVQVGLAAVLACPAWGQTQCSATTAWVAPFAVIQEGGHTLTAKNSHCREFPITALDANARSQNILAGSLGDTWLLAWANRCTNCAPGEKSNIPQVTVNGAAMRYKFSSVEAADACTVAQLYVAVGDVEEAKNTVLPAGVSAIMPGDNTAGFLDRYGQLMDVCDLRAGVAPSTLTGVMLDYEVCDNRSPWQTTRLAGAYTAAARAHKLKSMLYTNRLTAQCGGIGNGITSDNGPELLRTFDHVSVMTDYTVGDANRWNDLGAQLLVYQPQTRDDFDKIFVQVQIGGMSGYGLSVVRQLIETFGLYGVEAWPNGTDVQSPKGAYFRGIRCLVYGVDCP